MCNLKIDKTTYSKCSLTTYDDSKTKPSLYPQPFHDGGLYHIETSPLICSANQWTGFYMISASVMKGLIQKLNENHSLCYSKFFVHIRNSLFILVLL